MRFIRGYIIIVLLLGGGASYAQTANTNYVRTRVPQIPITDATRLDTIPVQRQAVSIQYSDGLGRPLQDVQVQGSPMLHDVIMPYVYDNMGRASKTYLPYAYQGSNNGHYRSAATTEVLNFYNPASPGAPKIPTDAAPYAQTAYEASPLGRVNEQGAPGTVFQTEGGRTVHATYLVSGIYDGVANYQVDSATLSFSAPTYEPGVLTRTIITDPDGHESDVWQDRQGRPIARIQSVWSDLYTAYVYNDLGQLAYILPPLGEFTASYIFRYDSIGRVTDRRAPGLGWVYTIYNHGNQPILAQDSNLRVKHQWVYLKYDAEGRVVQTGLYTNATVTGRKDMQYLCDNSYPTLWETWQPGTGYTNNAFPQSNAQLYTTWYYDDYSFPEAGSKAFQTSAYGAAPTYRTMGMLTGTSVYVLGSAGQYLTTVNYYDNQNRLIQQQADNHLGQVDMANSRYNFIGELTATEQKTNTTADSTITIRDRYVNDHAGRLLDTWESFRGQPEVDLSHNVYNEVDQKVSEGLHTKGQASQGPAPQTITRSSALTGSKTDIARKSVTLEPGFTFTATDTSSYVAAIGYGTAQTEEFRYNIRGWLTSINNGTLKPGPTMSDSSALFGESISYWEHSPLGGAFAQYNGNISGFTWRNRVQATGRPGMDTLAHGYSFTYEQAGRYYDNAYYGQTGPDSFGQVISNAYTEQVFGYEIQGTIGDMQRRDVSGSNLNDFELTYLPGGQLSGVTDYGTENRSSDYTYDGNGNRTGDSYKGLTITYNYLNLPDTVRQTSTGNKLIMVYDAAGNKLYKKLVSSAGTILLQRHYIENAEVTATSSIAHDGRVDNIAMTEGQIVNTAAGFRYEYNLQDHLGNNRVSFRPQSDSTVQVSSIRNYYPFGREVGDSSMNYSLAPDSYRYQDKEWESELGMDTYDFGARQYDPALGMWNSVDPLAVQYPAWPPYNYALNNPINMVDPDGMQPGTGTGGGYQYGFPIGGGTAGSLGKQIFSGASIAGGAVSLGASVLDSWSAFSLKTVDVPDVAAGIAHLQGNVIAPRSSIPQVNGPVQLDRSGITADQRNFANKVTANLVNEYAKTHTKGIPVGKFNPATGQVQGSGTVEQLFPENVILQGAIVLGMPEAGLEELGEAQYTKSSLQLGQEMHNAYKAGLEDKIMTFKEFRDVPGIRPDFVDFNTNTIYELKPFNPRNIKLGTKQLNNYKVLFEKRYGGIWNTVLDHY